MYRSLCGTLSCLALTTLLTCSEPSPPVSRALPPISQAALAVNPRPQEVDPEVAAVIDYLLGHRSGLVGDEIEEVANAIVRGAHRHGFDPNLVLALIHIESRGNNFALSPVGAMGLMQIMPATGEELARRLEIPWTGPQILFDPLVNVQMGIAYLEELKHRYANTTTALAAYNWGPGSIDSRIRRGVPLPVQYSGAVLATYNPGTFGN
jgi:soluble lytic murein transglycosylase-like protein